jgi:hypothetical protein
LANQYKNEVIYNGQTLISLKEDTITPSKVLSGETFHDRSGAPQTGSMIVHNVYDGLDSSSTDDALSANMGKSLNSNFAAINGVPTVTLTGNLNDALTPGWYIVDESCTNKPPETYDGRLRIELGNANHYVRQTYYCGYNNHIYTRTRRYINGWVWNNWEEITNSKLSSCKLKTFTMNCTTDVQNGYAGQLTLTVTETENAQFIVPQFARKSGYGYPLTVAYENGALRLWSPASLEGVTVGVVLFFCENS